MRTSDMKRLGEAWASVTSKKLEEGYTDEEVRELCHSKDHDCAITVNHPEWGLGKPVYESHAIPDEDGNVEWYDVQFKHGIEEKVPAVDMEIMMTEKHKKKTEDASNDEEDDGEGIDKVDPKAAKKKFKDRKDKDIDNDGDVDDSDEFLHKRRKAIGKAMDDEEEAPKKKKKVVGNDGEKKAEISKIGEATDELLNMIETAAKQQKSNATKPEEIMDKESPKSKEFANAHKKSDKKIEDNEEDGHDKTFKAASTGTKPKSGKRPQDNAAGDTNVVKSTEAPVKGVKEDIDMDAKEGSVSLVDMARDVLSGKTMSELRQELKQDDSKNPYDGRLKTAKGFLERMNRRRGYEKKDEE